MTIAKYRSVNILSSKMSNEMETDVIDFTRRGFELYNTISEIPKYVTDKLDGKWGYSQWQCFIYEGNWSEFEDKVYFYDDRYITFRIGEYLVLVWGIIVPKHGNNSACNIA